jgi:hypothetical protein
MLVEAAWVAAKIPGPLRAFFERIRSPRGMRVAAVATARKLAVLCWHLITRGEDYAFERPSPTEKKLRALELRAGLPSRRGRKGKVAAYSLKEVRRRERELADSCCTSEPSESRTKSAPSGSSSSCLTTSSALILSTSAIVVLPSSTPRTSRRSRAPRWPETPRDRIPATRYPASPPPRPSPRLTAA